MSVFFLPFTYYLLLEVWVCVCRYLATASSDHTVKIWNVDGFTLEKTLVGNLHPSDPIVCSKVPCTDP